MSLADEVRSERSRFHHTLATVGPDAETEVGGWRAAQLASHVAAQDRLWGLPAHAARTIVALTGFRGSALYLDRPRLTRIVSGRVKPWAESLALLQDAPPPPLVGRRIAPITLWEHFVHHEDVRRPNHIPRAKLPNLWPVLDWLLRYNGPCLDRTINIHTEGRSLVAGSGQPLTITGDLDQVVLWLSGRRNTALDINVDKHELERLRIRVKS